MLYYALKPPLWQEHRVTHEFRFPCCLCPARSFGGDGKYKETQVEKGVEGHYAGKWVATCAQRSCPYFGESSLIYLQHPPCLICDLACLDDFVGKPWIGTRDYSLRGKLSGLLLGSQLIGEFSAPPVSEGDGCKRAFSMHSTIPDHSQQ